MEMIMIIILITGISGAQPDMRAILLATAVAVPLVAAPLAATTDDEYTIVIRDHQFEPAEIAVPAGTRVKLTIDNQDGTPEEFESHALKREKVIPGNSKAVVWVGPLEPGRYPFVGEFHEDTAKGVLTAK